MYGKGDHAWKKDVRLIQYTNSNFVNLLSTELIVDKKIKAKQLTDLQLFSHIKNIHKPLCLQQSVT